MSKAYRVAWYNRFLRWLLRPVFRGVFHLLSRVTITGRENVPAHGPYMIAINHISLFEPPFMLAFWPVAPEAAGAVDLWNRPGQSLLARIYGGIQVHRGEYDRKLIDTMLSVLEAGYPLLLAPEGGRSHTPGMRRAYPGVAYLVERAGVEVVPVGLVGTTDDFLRRALRGQRPNIEMRIGKPLRLPMMNSLGLPRQEARQRNADLIMEHIAALLPEDYRGVYASPPEVEHERQQSAPHPT